MHVIAPEGASTCRSKSAEGEWVEKVYDHVIACYSPKGKISQMKVVEDFESRPHKAVSFVWKEKRRCRNGLSRSCQRCFLATVEEGCQEEAKGERGREEEEEEKESKREKDQGSNRSRSGCGHEKRR